MDRLHIPDLGLGSSQEAERKEYLWIYKAGRRFGTAKGDEDFRFRSVGISQHDAHGGLSSPSNIWENVCVQRAPPTSGNTCIVPFNARMT